MTIKFCMHIVREEINYGIQKLHTPLESRN